jgi:hypothetical protein
VIALIKVDAAKLRELVERRGFENFEAVAEKARARGLELGVATIYNIAANKNWTRDKVQTLCEVLECDPRDFVYFERNGNGHPKAIAPAGQRRRTKVAA